MITYIKVKWNSYPKWLRGLIKTISFIIVLFLVLFTYFYFAVLVPVSKKGSEFDAGVSAEETARELQKMLDAIEQSNN